MSQNWFVTSLRFVRIARVTLRFGLDEVLLQGAPLSALPWPLKLVRSINRLRRFEQPRGVRIRQAFETLGPIFVSLAKSCRRDATCCQPM